MQFTEHVSVCPLCGAKKSEEYERWSQDFAGTSAPQSSLIYRICCHCGLVFQSPRATQAELNAFYAAEYRRLYHGDEKPVEGNLQEQRLRAAHLAEILGSRRPVSHLDIGCSAGVLLNEFKDRLDVKTSVGIEPSDAHRAAALDSGFKAFASLDQLAAARALGDVPEKFDLITLAHVLEHISGPVEYLKELRTGWLEPEGLLLIEVPNLFGHASFEIAHLYAFDQKTLGGTLAQAGFEIVVEKLHSVPRGGKGLRYITIVARPTLGAVASVAPAKWRLSHLRRRQGMSGHSWPVFFAAAVARTVGLKRGTRVPVRDE